MLLSLYLVYHNCTDQGQAKEDASENRSFGESKNYDQRDSLSFKPTHILKAPQNNTSEVPMSFGGGMLPAPDHHNYMDDDM